MIALNFFSLPLLGSTSAAAVRPTLLDDTSRATSSRSGRPVVTREEISDLFSSELQSGNVGEASSNPLAFEDQKRLHQVRLALYR